MPHRDSVTATRVEPAPQPADAVKERIQSDMKTALRGGDKLRDGFPATTMPVVANPVKVFDEALALVADLQYKQAADKFHSVVDPLDEAGDHRRAAEAVFWFGYCREKLGDLDSARRQAYRDSARLLYKRLIEHYPKSAAAARATARLAALKGKTGKP